ncbi:protein of unknown function (plasmid) [Pararobbsia alpina]
MPVAELTRQVGISEQTFYRWKRGFPERELRQLQDETAKLKRVVVALTLYKFVFQDVLPRKLPCPCRSAVHVAFGSCSIAKAGR